MHITIIYIINRNPSNLDIPFPSKNKIAKMIIVVKWIGSCFLTVSFLTLIYDKISVIYVG